MEHGGKECSLTLRAEADRLLYGLSRGALVS